MSLGNITVQESRSEIEDDGKGTPYLLEGSFILWFMLLDGCHAGETDVERMRQCFLDDGICSPASISSQTCTIAR